MSPLVCQAKPGVADILNQLLDLLVGSIHVHTLVDARQEYGTPVVRSLDRMSAGAHRNESGQVPILRAQPIRQPGTEAGPGQRVVAAVHQHERWLVVWHIRLHRAHHAQVIRVLAEMRKHVTDRDAALPVANELEWRRKRCTGQPLGHEVGDRQGFAVVPSQHRLGVKAVHVRQAAVHENVNDALGPGRKVRAAWRERIGQIRAGLRPGHHVPQPQLRL